MHEFGNRFEGDLSQRRAALKGLYREVAKRVHPDLTSDDADRSRRQRLMAEANRAFEQGDSHLLARILEDSSDKRESVQESAAPADLPRAIRKITLQARLHFTFMERYDNDHMQSDRRLLAENLLDGVPGDEVHQNILNFFEELQMFLQDSYLNESLIWSTFGFAVVRWWAVSEEYVLNERKDKNDGTLFAGFQELAARFAEMDAEAGFTEPGLVDLVAFLEGERTRAAA